MTVNGSGSHSRADSGGATPAGGAAAGRAADPVVAAVLAVDVGNSKTDLVLVSRSGDVLAAVRGPTVSHQRVTVEEAFAKLAALAARAATGAGISPVPPLADVASYCAAGADLPSDVALLRHALAGSGMARENVVLNDSFAALRAGTNRDWGVCVICGTGMNCVGVGPDHRVVRFDALGPMSGDWGGGGALGWAGLGAAVRAQDGRGPRTLLETLVPAHFGLPRPRAVTAALYRGTLARGRHLEIAPLVFEAAAAGDRVAAEIVERQADEVVAFAVAAVRRLRLLRSDPDVVLAGGVFRTAYAPFHARIREAIGALVPRARVVVLATPPVVGAALLGLDRLAGGVAASDAEARVRSQLSEERLASGR